MTKPGGVTFLDMIVSPVESLERAMRRMNVIRKGVLLVCDERGVLVGVLSDGDARRAITHGCLLSTPIGKLMNPGPHTARSAAEATARVRDERVLVLPVLNSEGVLTAVVVDEPEGPRTLFQTPQMEQSVASPAKDVQRIALIPARGGSKRIPRKNLQVVGGRTLLEWTIRVAQAARSVDEVVVSTEDEEIAERARDLGATIRWLRPAQLATDAASSAEVVLYELQRLRSEVHGNLKFALLLEATAPIRSAEQLDEAVRLLETTDADCVMAVCALPHTYHPEEVLRIIDGELAPYLENRTLETRRLRGAQLPALIPSGVVYGIRVEAALRQRGLFAGKVIPLVTKWEEYLDIDTPEDLAQAHEKVRGFFNPGASATSDGGRKEC